MPLIAGLLGHVWPFVAMGVMALGLFTMWEIHKVDKLEMANKDAVIEQKNKDAIISAKQIGQLNGQLQATEAKAQPLIKEIYHEKVTATCGPAVQRAADGVRMLLDTGSPGNANPGPVSPGAVRKASAAPVPLIRH